MSNQQREHWSGRIGFILAASGSAVGLGNIWKFPYVTGANGGGVFVLFYLFCIALVGLPAFMAELRIGQESQANAVDAFRKLDRPKSPWVLTGWAGILSAFLILSFYSVIGGWVFDFLVLSITGEISPDNASGVGNLLTDLQASVYRQTLWHVLFMSTTVIIVLSGVKEGVEKYTKILMPLLFILLIGLLIKATTLPGFSQAFHFLFDFDFSKFNEDSLLEAVGHSFFTLSVGIGCILTYGSYLSKEDKIVKTSLTVAVLDTVVALTAGLIIFSIVFSTEGVKPNAGPGLMFQTLPLLFAKMEGGQWLSISFFLLISFAAVTSAVSILEVIVAYWHEEHNISRPKATIMLGMTVALIGMLTVLSQNHLADFLILGSTFFGLFDNATSLVLMPICGVGFSLYFGWSMSPKSAQDICGNKLAAIGLMWLCRVFVPIAIAVVVLFQIF